MTVEWEDSPREPVKGKGAVIACSTDVETLDSSYLVVPVGGRAPVWIGQSYLTHSRVAGH